MSVFATATSTWETMKPRAIALAIGLVVGPLISNYAGWQVTSGTSQGAVRAAVVEQQALICEERARAEVKDTDITSKVKMALHNDKLTKDENIHVKTVDGVVTLRGHAPSTAAHRAERLARDTTGVVGVNDKVKVTDSGSMSAR